MFEAVSDGLIIFDSYRHCLAANQATLRLLGIETTPAYYQEIRFPDYKLHHPDGKPFRKEEYPSYRATHGHFQQETPYYFINSQGERVDIMASTAPIPTQGEQQLFVGILRDVTEKARLQERLENALATAEQQAADWEAVFESMNTGILIYSQADRYVAANRTILHMFGVDSLAELNQQLSDPLISCQRIHARDEDGTSIDSEQSALYRVVIKRESLNNLPRKWLNLQGQELDLLISGGPVRRVGGQDQRFAFVINDVSKIRQLERARQEFMQVVSHELRNPLQVISGLVQLLQLKLSPDSYSKVGQQVELLYQQVNHLALLADDVLTAYRLGTTRLNVRVQRILLSETLRGAILPYQENRQHHLLLEEAWDDDVFIRADTQRLIQILSNLLSNAIKYTPAGKRVWVSRQLEEDHVIITVEDEGVGIPVDYLEKVFEGFVRAQSLTEWRSGGIGLGLYISRNLARNMSGDLWAEERPGGGAVLRLRLQRA